MIVVFTLFCLMAIHISDVTSSDCESPLDPGLCLALFPRWGFDKLVGKCRKFTYGGCGGNGNNYQSKKECRKACGGPGGRRRGGIQGQPERSNGRLPK
nr:Kunitz protease inhibitor [Hymenolepis microstoma]